MKNEPFGEHFVCERQKEMPKGEKLFWRQL